MKHHIMSALLLLLSGCTTIMYEQGDCVTFTDPRVVCEALIVGDTVNSTFETWYVVEKVKCKMAVPNSTIVRQSEIKPATRCSGR